MSPVQQSSAEFTWKPLYTGLVVAVVAALIVGGGGWVAYSSWQQSNEEKIQVELARIEREMEAAKNSQNPAANFGMSLKMGKPTAEQVANWKSQLEALVKKAGRTQGAKMAAILLLDLELSSQDKKSLVESFGNLSKSAGRDLVTGLFLMALGRAHADINQCEVAIDLWKKVSSESRWVSLHKESQLKTAVCYADLKKNEEAKVLLEKLAADTTDRGYSMAAGKYLRSLSL